ncbi:MAG: OprO/OprP family phosphate-selective porin [Prevotellaceae bacterium]|nr:OprO/OprP family phosphate-selective porin [Prevotellaceae bacterium]
MKYKYVIIRSLICCLCIMASLSKIKAQDKNDERIEKIEKIIARLPKISGIFNMRYQYSDENDGSNSFDIRRARLDFRGNISSSLDYRVHLEFAKNPRILDAFVNWKAANAFNIKAGEFKIPFSLENPYSAQGLEMVDNSMVITGLCGYEDVSGISGTGRDMGVNFHGKFLLREDYSLLGYSVGLFNGNGVNVSDNNKSKDFSGTFFVNPLKELTLSLSHHNGAAGAQGATIQRVRTGVGTRYDNNKLLVRGEYIYGKTGNMDSDGYYVVAGYFVHPKVQALAKYDYFQRDISVKETRQTNYVLGVNYFPVKNFHFKLNYSYRTTVGSPDVNHVALQFFAIF